jgi:hypothetical protein
MAGNRRLVREGEAVRVAEQPAWQRADARGRRPALARAAPAARTSERQRAAVQRRTWASPFHKRARCRRATRIYLAWTSTMGVGSNSAHPVRLDHLQLAHPTAPQDLCVRHTLKALAEPPAATATRRLRNELDWPGWVERLVMRRATSRAAGARRVGLDDKNASGNSASRPEMRYRVSQELVPPPSSFEPRSDPKCRCRPELFTMQVFGSDYCRRLAQTAQWSE